MSDNVSVVFLVGHSVKEKANGKADIILILPTSCNILQFLTSSVLPTIQELTSIYTCARKQRQTYWVLTH
jgi:hypothetical protein